MSEPRLPTLVVVSGPPGVGKTTLAHDLARAIGCPAVCRDEIKEGMAHAAGGEFEGGDGDPLTLRTLPLFFEVVRLLLRERVSVVAEAAFQDPLWRTGLEPVLDAVRLRIVHCAVDAAVAFERASRRAESDVRRRAHGDAAVDEGLDEWRRRFDSFDRISVRAPSLEVDTTDGYVPGIDEIVAFVDGAAR